MRVKSINDLKKFIVIATVFICIIAFMSYTVTHQMEIVVKENSNSEEQRYSSLAKELGVKKKEIILSKGLFDGDTYTVETSNGTYKVQFDDNNKVKRLIEEK